MTWTEAIAAMRAGHYVTRPRTFTVLTIRRAATPDGKLVDILADPRYGFSGIKSLTAKQRAATDWHICRVGIE